MDRKPGTTFSIKKRLILLLGCVAIGISGASYVLINSVVSQTVVATQDRLLSAAIASIVDNLYSEDGEVSLDLPYDTFSLLGAIGEDQVFYKISEKNTVITGYVDLPKIANPGNVLNPSFKQFQYRGKAIRLAAVNYPLIINGQTKVITILVAQTMNFQDITLQKISKNFIPIVIIFTLTLVLLALGAANLITNPLNEFATKVQRRGPNDLRKIIQVVPEEVIPLVEAFNDLLKKLRGTLRQTETFIAEAAHHIRTPLAVVKSESELALRKSRTPENREHLRQIIRSVDQTNRSATQLLDHAMVLYRAERPDKTGVMINNCMAGLLQQLAPAAALKDILIKVNDETTGEIFMEVDRNLFETAIRNLLDNAVKYSPVEKQICVNYSATKHHYKIEIKNERIGVKSLNFRGLLKRFKRGSNAAEVPGSGLGLSIANEAIMALKGDLKIFQSRGNTICATVSLPFFLIFWVTEPFALTAESVTDYGTDNRAIDVEILSSTDQEIFEPILEEFVKKFPNRRIRYTVASTSDIFEFISTNQTEFDLVMSSAMDLQIKLVNDGLAASLDLSENLQVPDWSVWQDQLVGFSAEPIVMVLSKKDFIGKIVPRTRRELISLIRNNPSFFKNRVITYDVNTSGAGFLFASQDARHSNSFWRLAEVFGAAKTKLVCCSGDMLDEIETGQSVLAYNLIGSYAEQHAKTRKNIEIVYPKDYTLILLRSALIPRHAKNKKGARQFINYLLGKDGQSHMTQFTGLLAPKSQGILDQGNFKPIRLDTGLLVYLDKLKRKRFLREWNEALVQ